MINNQTELCSLFTKYKSDKCPQIFHSYSPVYYELLKSHKLSIKSLIEIGIGNKPCMINTVGDQYVPGASLRAWRDFFPNSIIYGLDINTEIFFQEERIECLYTDQSSEKALLETINKIKTLNFSHNNFDIIIDDGSHIKNHMILSFNVLSNFLNKKGIYIIEDIKRSEIQDFIDLANENMKIEHIHYGQSEWDDFIMYKKTNRPTEINSL
jgi:demethylmacrocin O-methyltransferase